MPPRVLRDYCRKTLTPQPLAESPPPLLAPLLPVTAGADARVTDFNPDSGLMLNFSFLNPQLDAI